MIKRGDYVVNVLTGKCGTILERYYADFRIWFEDGSYWVVRERHLRKAMRGEVRRFLR